MALETYIERRKRGFFGWLFLLIFLGWNIIMVIWIFAYGNTINDSMSTATSDAARAGAQIGAGIGIFMILIVWAVGAIVTGLLALLTRGSKTIVKRVE